MVNYKGNTDTYMLTACILRWDVNGKEWYQAELTDIKANSLVYDFLEKVGEIE